MPLPDLARDSHDAHQAMRRELAALRLHAALAAPDLAGLVAATVVRLNVLVSRAEKTVETYVATAAGDDVTTAATSP